jgi:hypothetical protein
MGSISNLFVVLATVVTFTSPICAQEGSLVFNNRVPGLVDAKVTFNGSASQGPGGQTPSATGDLFLVSLNGVTKNVALTSSTTFRSSSAAASFDVNQVDVSVPGSKPGDTATLIMRAYSTCLVPMNARMVNQHRSRLFSVVAPTPRQICWGSLASST